MAKDTNKKSKTASKGKGLGSTTDNPRPVPPLQQTPDRGPIDPRHEPAMGDGEPGEIEDEDVEAKTSEKLEKDQEFIDSNNPSVK